MKDEYVSVEGVDPADRGHLRIGGRVVEKIAAKAALDVGEETDPGLGLRPARAGVSMHNNHATVALELDVPYPGRIADSVSAVRRRVRLDVERLTGLPVVRIDVTVSRLTRSAAVGGKRRRVE